MELDELYTEITTKGSIFCYPFINNNEDEDFLGYVLGLINQYEKLINTLDKASIDKLNNAFSKELLGNTPPQKKFDILRDVKGISETVKEVLRLSYRSYHEDAFKMLIDFLQADNKFYLNMLPNLYLDKCDLYRLRTDHLEKYKDGELFHVPFEKREFVSTQRFSIPGYPALYLSDSFYTCWCEFDKPALVGLSFAKFRYKRNQKSPLFLDLCWPDEKKELWEMYSFLAMYPLLMSCMVRVKTPNAPFKPEYLMPQLMMKIVREQNGRFAGIVYMPNKLSFTGNLHSIKSRNYVVCVYNAVCKSGHDKDLASCLEMTPIHTLTQEDVDNATSYNQKRLVIDFAKLEEIVCEYHDIEVEME